MWAVAIRYRLLLSWMAHAFESIPSNRSIEGAATAPHILPALDVDAVEGMTLVVQGLRGAPARLLYHEDEYETIDTCPTRSEIKCVTPANKANVFESPHKKPGCYISTPCTHGKDKWKWCMITLSNMDSKYGGELSCSCPYNDGNGRQVFLKPVCEGDVGSITFTGPPTTSTSTNLLSVAGFSPTAVTVQTSSGSTCQSIEVSGTSNDGEYALDSRTCNDHPVWSNADGSVYIQQSYGTAWCMSPDFCTNAFMCTCQGYGSNKKWGCDNHPLNTGGDHTLGMPWEEKLWVNNWWETVQMQCTDTSYLASRRRSTTTSTTLIISGAYVKQSSYNSQKTGNSWQYFADTGISWKILAQGSIEYQRKETEEVIAEGLIGPGLFDPGLVKISERSHESKAVNGRRLQDRMVEYDVEYTAAFMDAKEAEKFAYFVEGDSKLLTMYGMDPALSMERFIGALRYSFQKKGKEVHSVVHHDKHKMRVRETPSPTPAPVPAGKPTPAPVPARKYYVMSRFACSDHEPSGKGPELIQPIRTDATTDECLSLCDMDAECTHVTLFRSDNDPTHCWLSRGEYVDSKKFFIGPVSRPLQIDSGFGYCISTTPAPPPPESALIMSGGGSGLEEESDGEGGNDDGGAPIAIIAAAGAGAVLLLGAICYVRKRRTSTKSVVSDPNLPSPEMSRQATENPNMEDDPTTIGKKPDEDNPNLILELNKVSSDGLATGHPKPPKKPKVCPGCAPGQGGKFEGANFCPLCGRRN